LESEAIKVQRQLYVFIRDEKPLKSIAERIGKRGEGSVSVIVLHEQGEREVEIGVPGKRLISPQIAGAIKAIPGVVDVELV
jgi:DNA polymerase-3 subunit alpha